MSTTERQPTPLDRAIDICNGVGALAAAIGANQTTVSMWRIRGSRVPIEYCAPIERATGGQVTRQQMRPDDWAKVWPELADATATGPGALDEKAAA